jgi:hypothetical protein
MNKTLWKSIGAVVSGFLTVVILSTITDLVLEALHVLPYTKMSTSQLFLALLYRMAYTVLGGYVTARLAPKDPQKLVVILGIIGTIAGIGGVFAGWNLSDHWYPIAIAVTGFPCVWLGGKLFLKN